MIRRRRLPEDPRTEPNNMTPMIDVVFQLLIFFMLSMHFKEVEGKLLSQLPKIGAMDPTPVPPDLREIRIILCAGGDPHVHRTDKGRHERETKDGAVSRILVDGHDLGEVHKTETHPSKASANRAQYRSLGARARDLHASFAGDPKGPPPVILDADSEVPYEHVIGALNACREVGLERVEFAANPKVADRMRR